VIALVGLSLGLDCRRRLTVGKTIYGKDREVDVLFRDARNGNRLAVEAKYQRVTGTADEKLPYAVLNLARCPCPGSSCTAGAASTRARCTGCARARGPRTSPGFADWLTVFFAL